MREGPVVPREAVGTVADEAARLIEALSGWTPTPASAGASDKSRSAEASQPADAAEPSEPSGAERSRALPNDEREEPGEQQQACAQCGGPVLGHASPAVAAVCRVCPVCQGVGLLSTLRPETLDRLVDVVSAALVGLRTLAEQARAAEGRPAGKPAEDIPVVDIPVVDEDATLRDRKADSRS